MEDDGVDLALGEIADGGLVLVAVRAGSKASTKGDDVVWPNPEGVSETYKLPDDLQKDYVEKAARLFQLKKTWTMEELEKAGIKNPGKNLKRPGVAIKLARAGFEVRVGRGGQTVTAKVIEGFGPAIVVTPVASSVASTSTASFVEAGEEDYFWMPPVSAIVKGAIANKIPVALVGPTGSGKTSLLERLLHEMFGEDPYIMSLHGDMSTSDFYGTKELRKGETVFRPGPALQAMLKKRPLIINELDMAAPEILACLQRPLEKKTVTVTEMNDEEGEPLILRPWHSEEQEVEEIVEETIELEDSGAEDGEDESDGNGRGRRVGRIQRKKRMVMKRVESKFMIVATANTVGRGDDSGLYRGAQVLNEAFLDRFPVIEFLGYPPKEEEVKILVKRTLIDESIAARIVDVANLARVGLSVEHRLNSTFSIRKTVNMAKLIARLGCSAEDAFAATVLNRVTTEDKVALAEMYQRIWGEKISPAKLGVTT